MPVGDPSHIAWGIRKRKNGPTETAHRFFVALGVDFQK